MGETENSDSPSKAKGRDVLQILERVTLGTHVALSQKLHVLGSHSKSIVPRFEGELLSIHANHNVGGFGIDA